MKPSLTTDQAIIFYTKFLSRKFYENIPIKILLILQRKQTFL